jgi:hypothetical protein
MTHHSRPLLESLRPLSLTLAFALSLLGSSQALAQPTLEVEPTRVEPGEIVLITIAGFQPGGYDGTINLNGQPVDIIDIPPGGARTFFWQVPDEVELGGTDIDICALCNSGDLEERTNAVRMTVHRGLLQGDQINLQVWGVEVTQGVRGSFATRSPGTGDMVLMPENIVHVANRRTIVRVYPWLEAGPDVSSRPGTRARLWVTRDGTTYGPLEPENSFGSVWNHWPDVILNDLRGYMPRTWNFVLPPEAVALSPQETSASFDLVVEINPDGQGQAIEYNYQDNLAYLYGNQIRHVGRSGSFAFRLRPHLVETTLDRPDSVQIVSRPTIPELWNSVQSLYHVLPIADGIRGVRLHAPRFVEWRGDAEDWDDGQNDFFIETFLPGGQLRDGPKNDFYAFLWSGAGGCSGHAYLFTPFLRSSTCGGPDYTLAHEVNHAIGASHAGFGHGEIEGGGYDPGYPFSDGRIEPDTWGINVYTMQLHPPQTTTWAGTLATHDFMSYGPRQTRWMSRYTWNLTAENLGSPDVGVGMEVSGFNLASLTTEDFPSTFRFAGAIGSDGLVDLQPFFATYEPDGSQGDGAYSLDFYDAQGQVLTTVVPQMLQAICQAAFAPRFAEAVLPPEGWASMILREGGVEIQSWQRSQHPPHAYISSHQDGFQWPNQGTVNLAWVATDLDGDPLTYRIIAQHEQEQEIYQLATGITDQSYELDLATLPGGGNWLLAVEVTDGFDSMISTPISGFVEPTAPVVAIGEPADGSVHLAGTKVPAMALVADIQGPLNEDSMIWFLNGNFLGYGSAFEVSLHQPGTHELELVYYNTYQLEGRAAVQIEVIPELGTTVLSEPENGAESVPQPVTLSWQQVPGAVSYRLQVADNPNMSPLLIDLPNLSETSLTGEPVPADQEFFWRVTAEHPSGPPAWSEVWYFTTGDVVSGVADTPAAPRLQLEIYPNPFNPMGTVAFELPRAGQVRVEVYDLTGRRVRTLLDGHRDSGRHQLSWDGRDGHGRTVSSGVYLVRLATPSGTLTQRSVLLK